MHSRIIAVLLVFAASSVAVFAATEDPFPTDNCDGHGSLIGHAVYQDGELHVFSAIDGFTASLTQFSGLAWESPVPVYYLTAEVSYPRGGGGGGGPADGETSGTEEMVGGYVSFDYVFCSGESQEIPEFSTVFFAVAAALGIVAVFASRRT